jgi:hypothetical protein
MALAADRKTNYREGVEVEYPVKASTKIYAGGMVCVDATGYAVPAADAAGNRFVGVAMEQADNSGSLVDGNITVRVRRQGLFELKATSIAQANVGADMYVVDDETFDESDPGNGIKCGKLHKVESATRGWLDIGSAVASVFTGAADALTVSDAGAFFPAATDTVAEQIQALAGDLIPILVPRQSGWTKDGTDQQAAGPKLELNYPCRIKRAYGRLGTVPGAGITLAVLFGADAMLSFGAADEFKENEALDIAVAANADLLSAAGGILLNETVAGAGDNLDLYLLVARDDGV